MQEEETFAGFTGTAYDAASHDRATAPEAVTATSTTAVVDAAVDRPLRWSAERYSQLIEQDLKLVNARLRKMRRTQQEIDDLRDETRAILRKLRAA